MLVWEIKAVSYVTHKEHTNTVCGQNIDIPSIIRSGTYIYH
jgi:hypothetical protein